ncbi:haloacid dehalogenase-like hydrolase [Legionella pneumophila]|uniref:Dot/Icm T4SS effector phosphotyrosine phosphatase Ceg4 n=1 Tax=Legionella pneumophila TaxID=446 RepID=UPI0004897A4E|nr:Dot/Icm T4SS effector phosphotyrosine phosphatase Ceg4 [Legionella pneumophila]RYW89910.1 haloacid dehalogenase-like hydrolase [Legionella pneumophila]STX97592.1 Dot/Icm T4SS effector [Legionella pneumophila]HAT1775624.1 HAD family hydrolase [Legionella pneumophila]HAT1778859.1 HAD family hydrolase [Legionella pneumophila]HAT2019039.1 HAD family hydrolase [Legionella pneumophila]
MPKVIIFTDFDGTVTGRSGNETVFTEFYQSLLQGYKKDVEQDYKNTPMKDPIEAQALFEAKYGKYNENFDHDQQDVDFLMSPEAVAFFHEVLKNNDVTVNIVTKNRVEYIKAVFKYQGFSDEEISKLTTLESGYKFNDVNSRLNHQTEKANRVYILDDSPTDYAEMLRAVKGKGYNEEEIRGYHKSPGEFEWSQYLEDVREMFPPKENSPEEVQLPYEQGDEVSIGEETPVLLQEDNLSRREETATVLSNQPVPSSDFRTLKIMGAFAGIGFGFGFALGVTLVATGVFAPSGVGLLGALTLGAISGTGTAALSSAIGFVVAEGTEITSESVSEEAVPAVKQSSHEAMRGLGGSQLLSTNNIHPVGHFPSILSRRTPTKGKEEQCQEEYVLTNPLHNS